MGVNSASTTSRVNYSNLLSTIQTLSKNWAYRSLTVLGKIQVCNSLLLSQFWYHTPILFTPNNSIFTQIFKGIRNFLDLSENKQAKVSYDKLIQDYKKGGQKLQDLFLKDWAFKVK